MSFLKKMLTGSGINALMGPIPALIEMTGEKGLANPSERYEDAGKHGQIGEILGFNQGGKVERSAPLTEEEIFAILKGSLPENAHSQMDTLINQNENKDYFELMDPSTTPRHINELMPWSTFPRAEAQMKTGFQEHGGLGQTIPAALRGVIEQLTGGADPVGPQGMPFSQFMQQKKALNPQVKSIIGQHVNELFNKETEPRQRKSLNPLKTLLAKNPNVRK